MLLIVGLVPTKLLLLLDDVGDVVDESYDA